MIKLTPEQLEKAVHSMITAGEVKVYKLGTIKVKRRKGGSSYNVVEKKMRERKPFWMATFSMASWLKDKLK